MAIVFNRNQILTKNDLNIFIKDGSNALFDPHFISYQILNSNNDILLDNQIPNRDSIGWFWANMTIPTNFEYDTYTLNWLVQDYATTQLQIVPQKFGVVGHINMEYIPPTLGGVVYYPGQTLSEKDLYIIIKNHLGNPSDAYQISYSVFQRIGGSDILVSPLNLIPVRKGVGHYYADYKIPDDALIGEYYILWTFKETSTSTDKTALQEFAVVNTCTIIKSPYSENSKKLIRKLRFILRDNNPDRNYHFMPPASEEVIQGFTQKFGYVWEDDELFEYIDFAVSDLNSHPPHEYWSMDDLPHKLMSLVLSFAAATALQALAINWAHDEWQGSISGVDLNLEKSSKFMSLKDSFDASYRAHLQEHKEFGVRIVKGLRMPRYSVGVMGALGPYNKMGVQSRRNFISSSRSMF